MSSEPATLAAVGQTLVAVLQVLQTGGAKIVENVLNELSPTSTAAVGGSGVAGIAVVRWLVKRSAASDGGGSGGGTSASSAEGTSVSTTASSGVDKHKVAFTLPGVLPLSKGIRSVTHNEVHAVELGLVVGLVAVWLWSVGKSNIVYSLVGAFVAGSLGYRRYSSKAFTTVRLEPWYALLALSGGAALGWGLFVMEPSLLSRAGLTALV